MISESPFLITSLLLIAVLAGFAGRLAWTEFRRWRLLHPDRANKASHDAPLLFDISRRSNSLVVVVSALIIVIGGVCTALVIHDFLIPPATTAPVPLRQDQHSIERAQDRQLADQRQAQLISAIKSISEISPASDTAGWTVTFTAITGGLSIFFFIMAVMLGASSRQGWIDSAALAKKLCIITASLTGIGELVLFSGDMNLNFGSAKSTPLQIEISTPGGEGKLDCDSAKHDDAWLVKSFARNSYTALEHGELKHAVLEILGNVHQNASHQVAGYILIGSADESEFQHDARGPVRSNVVLAQNRAKAVRDIIKEDEQNRAHNLTFITVPRGAEILNKHGDSVATARDRSVQICVLWK